MMGVSQDKTTSKRVVFPFGTPMEVSECPASNEKNAGEASEVTRSPKPRTAGGVVKILGGAGVPFPLGPPFARLRGPAYVLSRASRAGHERC